MTRMEFEDLIGLRYRFGGRDPRTGIDCLWISGQVLRRIFPNLDPSELPADGTEAEALMERADRGAHIWRLVPKGMSLLRGDLLYGLRGSEHAAYCGVIVDPCGPLLMTAMPEHGSIRIPLRRLRGLQAVYRRGPR